MIKQMVRSGVSDAGNTEAGPLRGRRQDSKVRRWDWPGEGAGPAR